VENLGKGGKSKMFGLLRNRKGFTLIELVIILGVLAVLAAILVPLVTRYISESRVTAAKADCKSIATAVTDYSKDIGKLPGWDWDDHNYVTQVFLTGEGASLPDYDDDDWEGLSTKDLYKYLQTSSGLSEDNAPSRILSKWNGPYLRVSDSYDPWGNPYILVVVTDSNGKKVSRVVVLSAGSDSTIDSEISLSGDFITSISISRNDVAFEIK